MPDVIFVRYKIWKTHRAQVECMAFVFKRSCTALCSNKAREIDEVRQSGTPAFWLGSGQPDE